MFYFREVLCRRSHNLGVFQYNDCNIMDNLGPKLVLNSSRRSYIGPTF